MVIEPASANLTSLGERATFTATITDQHGAAFPGTVKWSASDEAVFTVDADGTVTAAGNGTGTLTASIDGLSATAEVVVEQVQAAATADTDRAALTALYNATGGPSWTRSDNWLSSGPLSEWHGVQVDTDGRVTSLALGGNNLTGSLPAQIGDLTSLGILQLYANTAHRPDSCRSRQTRQPGNPLP